jgi:hypothetical protein
LARLRRSTSTNMVTTATPTARPTQVRVSLMGCLLLHLGDSSLPTFGEGGRKPKSTFSYCNPYVNQWEALISLRREFSSHRFPPVFDSFLTGSSLRLSNDQRNKPCAEVREKIRTGKNPSLDPFPSPAKYAVSLLGRRHHNAIRLRKQSHFTRTGEDADLVRFELDLSQS